MRTKTRKTALPIGRTARLACQIEAMRLECCRAAQAVMNRKPLDEAELEEAAKLDDALDLAHRILKTTVGGIILSRLKRRSRATPGV